METERSVATEFPPRWMIADSGTGEDEPDSRPPAGSERDARRLGKTNRSSRILVVDDDMSIREMLVDLLELAGYLPIPAADAPEALMILRQGMRVDALVTDLSMPGADGIMLIRHARDIRPDLPAILLTGYGEHATAVTAISGGNVRVMLKPVESERLIAQIDLLVQQARAP